MRKVKIINVLSSKIDVGDGYLDVELKLQWLEAISLALPLWKIGIKGFDRCREWRPWLIFFSQINITIVNFFNGVNPNVEISM